MKEYLEKRLNELKAEFEAGQKMLADLAIKQTDLQNTMIRISGAIQVLEELLSQTSAEEQISGKTEEPKIQKVALG